MNFRVPGILYKGLLKVVYYFILPYGIMSTIPTELLAGSLSRPGLFQALFVVVFFTWFTIWFWRFGLRHYDSAAG